jgi:hypothetical protein
MHLGLKRITKWFSILLLLISYSFDAPVSTQTRSANKYGRKDFRRKLEKVGDLTSPLIKRYLPAFSLALVREHNPDSAFAGPSYFFHTLASDGTSDFLIDTNEKAIRFLENNMPRVDSEKTALEIAQLFLELRKYSFVDSPGDINSACGSSYDDGREEESGVEVPRFAHYQNGGFTVTLFAITDQNVCALNKFTLKISESGAISLDVEDIGARSGYM